MLRGHIHEAKGLAILDYRPMLATDAPKPPRAGTFDFEIKFDGFRCGAIIEAGRLRLMSRQGTNFTSWFPELADLASGVASADALLDGEVIAGAGDVESFNTLLRRARLRGKSTPNALPVSFVAFDLLWHDGADLTQLPLGERRTHLRAIVTESSPIAVSRTYADGSALLAIAAAHGLEGVIAKDRRSAYEPGRRSRSWLKTKVPGAHLAHEWNGDA
jgi:bifunctional non-homologous end joining protein LigD